MARRWTSAKRYTDVCRAWWHVCSAVDSIVAVSLITQVYQASCTAPIDSQEMGWGAICVFWNVRNHDLAGNELTLARNELASGGIAYVDQEPPGICVCVCGPWSLLLLSPWRVSFGSRRPHSSSHCWQTNMVGRLLVRHKQLYFCCCCCCCLLLLLSCLVAAAGCCCFLLQQND